MAHAFIMDFEGATLAQYDAVLQDMGLREIAPQDAIYHAVGLYGDGLRVCDVWKTPEAFAAFAQASIIPLTRKHGIGEARMRSFEVREWRLGPDPWATPAFLQIVRIPGVDAAGFVAMDTAVMGGVKVPDGVIWHVNGEMDGDYYVLDTWESREKRDRFVNERISPAIEAFGLGEPPGFEEFDVHNSLRPAEAITV